MRASIIIAVSFTLSSACAASTPTPTTIPPEHQSVAGEQSAAAAHDRAGGALERQAASETGPAKCGPPAAGAPGQICWTSTRTSGAASSELMRAATERDAAAQHRRVSQALRDAETMACAGISQEDMTHSPFAHRDDIVDAQVIEGPAGVLGARVRFHELSNLTADWLQHVVDCHVARDNALGHEVPEMGYCPLVPRGASAVVTAVPHGYVVEVRSNDPDGAREIARRAKALVAE